MISGEYLQNKESIKSILSNFGYNFKDYGDYLTCAANFRGGDDIGSIVIYPQKVAIDYVTSTHYKIDDFLSIVTNKKTKEELEAYYKENNFIINTSTQPEIKQIKIFPDSVVNELVPEYSYWIKRGISEDILRETKGGLYGGDKGVMKNRFVFPVFNSRNQVIMLSGRDTTNNDKRPKWLHRGTKQNCYPAFINAKYIKEKNSVFIVESPGDFLSLATCGIRNSLVMFGTELNLSILNYLLKINIGKIYISPNNDHLTNNAGNDASKKIYKKLSKYFNSNQIKIVLVKNYKDWNDCLLGSGKQEILEQLKEYIN